MTVQEQPLRRYQVALYLIPDQDVAGDIFMDARNEEALVRRAVSWRRDQGFSDLDLPAELPPLSEAQRLHGLHLASRARGRRTARWVLGFGLAGVLALLGGIGLKVVIPVGLTADRTYDAFALSSSDTPDGSRFSLYKVEADGNDVTIWWDLRGQGAGTLTKPPSPELQLGGTRGWRAPVRQVQKAPRGDRLLGRSTYKVVVGGATDVNVRLTDIADKHVDLWLAADLQHKLGAQNAVNIPLNQQVAAGPAMLVVDSVTVSPQSTTVRFKGTVTAEMGLPYPVALRTGNSTFRAPLPSPPPTGPGIHEVTFGPLMSGDTGFTLFFTGASEQLGTLTASPTELLTDVRQFGSLLNATLILKGNQFLTRAPTLTDDQGQVYQTFVQQGPAVNGAGAYFLRVDRVPPGVKLVTLTMRDVVRVYPGLAVNVDLYRYLR